MLYGINADKISILKEDKLGRPDPDKLRTEAATAAAIEKRKIPLSYLEKCISKVIESGGISSPFLPNAYLQPYGQDYTLRLIEPGAEERRSGSGLPPLKGFRSVTLEELELLKGKKIGEFIELTDGRFFICALAIRGVEEVHVWLLSDEKIDENS